MRARSGWARALAIRASEVSPAGRPVFSEDEVLDIVTGEARRVSSRNARRYVNVSSRTPLGGCRCDVLGRLSAFEVKDGELGRDRPLRGAVAALRAVRRDRQRLLVRLGEQLVELLERLLVELQRRALEDDLGVLERAGRGRRGEIVHQLLD